MTKTCRGPRCSRPARPSTGLCKAHGEQLRRGSKLSPIRPVYRQATICTFPECGRETKAYGLCSGHVAQRRAGKVLMAIIPKRPRIADGSICDFPACERPEKSRGLCSTHASMQRRCGSLRPIWVNQAVLDDPLTWNRSVTRQGYIVRHATISGQKMRGFEHRVVMEGVLGRPLRPEETVHHINGVRSDNRPKNLELWSSSHPPGQRVADKIAWAWQILELYSATD